MAERVGEDIAEGIDGKPESLEDIVRETKRKPPATEDIASKKCHNLGMRRDEGRYKMFRLCSQNSWKRGASIKHLYYILHPTIS